MLSRRKFIQHTSLSTAAVLAGQWATAEGAAVQRLVILHTNDVHSRLEAFPMDGSRNEGAGGIAARAKLISDIRAEEEHVLLLDAGDIFQGTPYFNLYKGEPEMKAMQMMGYDACTMGNHDFDAGLENFATQLKQVSFPVLLCNYDFTQTAMEQKSAPYKIFTKGKLKIGVTGVGIEMKGLVPDNLAGNTKYLDPVQKLNETAEFLKRTKGCDMVICLSHLGYQYRENSNKICDVILAKETEHVDLIIGGHTHTFLDEPMLAKNKKGEDVLINQVGWGGIRLGRLDYEFMRYKKKNLASAKSISVGKKT
ncbi:bifunctional metallophosphatase/5'-nucleotidase [Lacibacter luteus]|uniref:Bifunctional metallophosphatase/5'-nucleotidase n=1 Tax=Lacibacter luteus TaxID=2508719 RepID=A0A4Q1CN82_9BACT|nr:metallophosphatase [Lacibacter luteus]RXK62568.1 bifunctional metallophosphatase/5'-nucleotidase [Lacibacter luteus]